MGIDAYNLIAICECDVKTDISTGESYSTFSPNKLSEKFKNVLSNDNIGVVKCVKLMFNLSKMKHNIGSFIMLFMIIMFLIFTIIYSVTCFKFFDKDN